MDPRLNHLLVPSEMERRVAAARRAPSGTRRSWLRRQWPSGRSVDAALFGRR
jgi:hypothetical protein